MPWPRFRNPIQKLIVPTADLGLGELDFSGLQFPTDVPLVLALQVVQTATGPRILQMRPSPGLAAVSPQTSVIRPLTTEGAGNTGVLTIPPMGGVLAVVEVLALAGAPTNIKYRGAFSLDGGTTWYQGVDSVATTTGVVLYALCVNVNNPGVGNSILAAGNMAMTTPPMMRLEWVFTGGTGPTVQHRITGLHS